MLNESVASSLPSMVLAEGGHDTLESGACALEWAYVLDRQRKGLPVDLSLELTDAPACVCPTLRAFVIDWNDSLPSDEDRTRILGPFVARLLDTAAGDEVRERRAWLATDWLARVCAPTWLDLAGLTEHAAALRALPELVDDASAERAQPTLDAARSAARSAAESAAESAARSAAESAAKEALAPTVATLQASACDLLDRMILVTETVKAAA